MKIYGVFYFGAMIRGPFASRKLAKEALEEAKRTASMWAWELATIEQIK